jgi:hypothetical protein
MWTRVGRRAVAGVAGAGVAGAGPLVRLEAQVLGQLLGQPAFEHRLGHLPQQPVLPEQLHTLLASPTHQLLGERGVHHRLVSVPGFTTAPFHRLSLGHIAHRVSSPSRPHGPGSKSRTYTDGLTGPLKARGVADVLIAVCDGLVGLPEAINAGWTKTRVQTCIVHLIRA